MTDRTRHASRWSKPFAETRRTRRQRQGDPSSSAVSAARTPASTSTVPGRAAEFELPHAAPLPDLLDMLLADGRVTLCTQCAARRGIGPEDVLPGVRIAGAAVFAEEILADGVQALVY